METSYVRNNSNEYLWIGLLFILFRTEQSLFFGSQSCYWAGTEQTLQLRDIRQKYAAAHFDSLIICK